MLVYLRRVTYLCYRGGGCYVVGLRTPDLTAAFQRAAAPAVSRVGTAAGLCRVPPGGLPYRQYTMVKVTRSFARGCNSTNMFVLALQTV